MSLFILFIKSVVLQMLQNKRVITKDISKIIKKWIYYANDQKVNDLISGSLYDNTFLLILFTVQLCIISNYWCLT